VKRVSAKLRDYAGNVSEICDCDIVNYIFNADGNATDLEVCNDKLYISYDLNGRLVDYKALVKQVAELGESFQITALTKLDNLLYMSAYNAVSNSTILYKFNGVPIEILSINGKVLSMAPFDGVIYMGLENGKIQPSSIDGIPYNGDKAITKLYNKNGLLFATVRNGGKYLSFNGAEWISNIV
jgi:hypothetical protein